MDVETQLQALLVVSVVSVAAPFVSAFLARLLVPQVVVLIAGGVLIGPQVGGLAEPESVSWSPTSGWASCSCSPATSWSSTTSASGPDDSPSPAGRSARCSRSA